MFVLLLVVLLLSTSAYAEREKRRAISAKRIPVARCKEFPGSIFKPCICSEKVPKGIKYRPALEECDGRAAAILSGNYVNSYSVVLRDSQNRDRFPPTGYHNCTPLQVEKGLNRCSAFKCQKIIKTNSSSAFEGKQQICCFGEAGTDEILAGATRMTIKLRDIPGSNADPLVRVCLNGYDPDVDLN